MLLLSLVSSSSASLYEDFADFDLVFARQDQGTQLQGAPLTPFKGIGLEVPPTSTISPIVFPSPIVSVIAPP